MVRGHVRMGWMRGAELTRQEQDRRNRLAAERMLVTSVDASSDKLRKLELANGTLHRRMADWRDQAEKLTAENAELRADRDRVARDAAEDRAGERMEKSALWAALQTIPDGFAIYDAQECLIAANAAYLSIFDGLDVTQPGTPVRDLFAALLQEGVVDPGNRGNDWPEYMAGRWRHDPIPPEVMYLWNGRIIKLIETRLPDGGVVSRGSDQTDMLRLQSAIEALPDGFVVFDAEDRLVTCNEQYRRFYAVSRDAITPGTTFTNILQAGLRSGQYQEAIGREEAWLEERLDRHQNLDGKPIEQQISDGRWLRVVEVETPDGGRAGFRIDITAMKEQEIELRRMHTAAQAAERAKSAFLSNMGHEIRTPMNGLVGTADLLLETGLDADQIELARTLRRSAGALLTFMDDVLDFSRAEADRIVLSSDAFSPVALVQETVASFEAQARLKGLTLVPDASPGLAVSFMGDARRIRQILANLLSNAVKFSDAGTVTVQAASDRSAKGQPALRLSVLDTGAGVPADRVEHIFQGFSQAQDGTARPHDGSGLGLAICRKLAEQMGGTLTYRDREGGGAAFDCVLPLPVASEPGPDAARADPMVRPVMRVVAAEDNATNRMVLGKLMEPLGVDLRIAQNGQECIDLVCADPPDLVLMDISMPDMDGCEATRRLRKWEADQDRPPLPIVAMTAHILPEEIQRFLTAGMDRVIHKPLKRDALSAELDNAREAKGG